MPSAFLTQDWPGLACPLPRPSGPLPGLWPSSGQGPYSGIHFLSGPEHFPKEPAPVPAAWTLPPRQGLDGLGKHPLAVDET